MSVPFVSRMKLVFVFFAVAALGMTAAACEDRVVDRSQLANQSSDSSIKASDLPPTDTQDEQPVSESKPQPVPKVSGGGLLTGLFGSKPEPLFTEDECITGLDYYFVDRQEYLHLEGSERYIKQDELIELFSAYDGYCLHQAVGSHSPGPDFPAGELTYALCGDHPAVDANKETLGKLSRLAQAHNPSNYFTGIECNSGKKEDMIRNNQYLAEGGPDTEQEYMEQSYEVMKAFNFEVENQARLEIEWEDFLRKMQMK